MALNGYEDLNLETSKEDDLEFLKLDLEINSFYVSKAEAGSTEKKKW